MYHPTGQSTFGDWPPFGAIGGAESEWFGPDDPLAPSGHDAAADPYDLTPVTPLVRGRSETQAVYDVARVATKASQRYPRSQQVAQKWIAMAKSRAASAMTESVLLATPAALKNLPLAAIQSRLVLKESGKVVLNEKNQKRIADAMAKVYAAGAQDLAQSGAMEYAAVLDTAYEGAENVKNIVEDASLKSGIDDAIDRGKTGLKFGLPAAAVLAVLGAVVYLKILK